MSDALSTERLRRLRSRLRWQRFFLNALMALSWGICYLAVRAFVPPSAASQHRGDPIVLALFGLWGLIIWWHRKRRRLIFQQEGATCASCGSSLSPISGRCFACERSRA